jgi:hypothetical protein
MKKGLGFFLMAIVLTANAVQAQEIALADPQVMNIQEQVLMPFFNALKSGNIEIIKKHISPELYARYRVLLDENRQYPQFLRDYYKDISFRVVKAKAASQVEGIVFAVSMDRGQRFAGTYNLMLSKPKNAYSRSDVWIIEEFGD